MAPTRKQSISEPPVYNFNKKKKSKPESVFNPIEDWKNDGKFITVPRVVTVPECDLNKEQLEILKLIKSQCELPESDFFKNPLRLIISGAAGTGKSVVIQHILKYLEDQKETRDNFDYWAVAPTAVAASTIQGQTVHSRFGLTKFSGNLYEVVKKKFEVPPNNVYFLIIDELSMLGRSLFHYMDYYLRQSEEEFRDVPFGGRSVVLCGDHWQLRPVKDSAIFEIPRPISDFQVRDAYAVYKMFTTVRILTTPNRQRGDEQEEFRQLLHRICRHEATLADVHLINSRRLGLLPMDEQKDYDDAMHVFGTNAGVYRRNL